MKVGGRLRRGPSAVVSVLLVVTAACGSDPERSPYVYEPDESPIDVNTSELRQMKADAGISNCPETDARAVTSKNSLPDITLPCLGGGRDTTLSGLTGAPTVINFWAQSCGPCRAESPIFQEVHQAAGERVDVIGVDFQDTRPDWAIAFADELGLTYPQLADPEGATRGPLQVAALPITLFVDKSGQVVFVEKGAVESAAELTTLISEHLGVDIADAL